MHTAPTTRRGLAVIAAGMIAFSGFGTVTAVAQTAGEPEIDANLVSQLNAGDTSTLTIHKLAGGFAGANRWGVEQQGVAGTPLDGVQFDIYRVGDIDLTTIEGWRQYDALRDTDANTLISTGRASKVESVTTANGGTATYTGPIGVYVVRENLAESTVTGNYVSSTPFIVALPFTTEAANEWNRNVHVYPKNQELGATKTVVDRDRQAADTITYTLGGSVPPIPETQSGRYFDGYSLLDVYDPEKWTPDTSTATVSVVNGETTTPLDANDFQVSTPKPYTQEPGSNAFAISLTRSGLTKLEAQARTGSDVRVTATVSGALNQALVPGDVINKAMVIPPNIATPNWDRSTTPDDTDNPPTPPTPPTSVTSKYGRLDVTKVNSREQNTTLAGATFQLYKCENNNTAGGDGTLLQGATPITVGGANSWTTDNEGKFTITGIQLEDWYNGASQTDVFDYCLVETQAPEGYELLPSPVLVPINSATPSATLASTIANVPSTPGTFRLPTTGEWGRWWLIAGGSAALIAALLIAYAATRRNDQSA